MTTCEEILEGHPCLRRTILYPRKRWTSPCRIPEMWRWGRHLRDEKYDMTIDLQGLFRSALMTWAAASPRRLGLLSAREGSRAAYNEFIADTAISAAERYLTCLEHLEIPVKPLDFQLTARQPLPEALNEFGPYIVLHPYSRWRTKLWPWRYYQELVSSMPERKFVLVGEGPWFPLEAPGQIVDLRGKLGIGQLVTVLDRARAVLSTDSGPAHIAGALGPADARPFRRDRLAQNQALRSARRGPDPCAVLFALPKTNLLARYAGGMHEPAHAAKDSGLLAASCVLKV